MAHFEKPPGADPTAYDVDHKSPIPGKVWLMRIPEGLGGEVALWGGSSLKVVSNNPKVIPPTKITRRRGPKPHTEIISMFGWHDGTSLVFAGTGEYQTPSWRRWTTLQVQVGDRPSGQVYVFDLDSPNMALNARGINVRYSMDVTETILPMLAPFQVVEKIGSGAKQRGGSLKHLAISAHGTGGERLRGVPPEIQLGVGIKPTDIDEFAKLKGKIGVIWAGSCAVAANEEGWEMCEGIVSRVGCHLVAATFLVHDLPPGLRLGRNQVEINPRCSPKVFTPPVGARIEFEWFLGFGRSLGFRVMR